jgi:hypothetical protein
VRRSSVQAGGAGIQRADLGLPGGRGARAQFRGSAS